MKETPTALLNLRYSLLAGALLALGCAGTASAQRAGKLTIGNEVNDEITRSARINYNNGSYSKLYRFKAQPGEVILFRIDGELDSQLSLYVDDKHLASSTRNDEESLLSFRIQSEGKHILAVSGRNKNALGTFSLKSERIDVDDVKTLTPGKPIRSWTDGSQDLQLQITQDGIYQVDMESDEFDSVLELSGNGLARPLKDDDSGEGLNSRLFVRLSPGSYSLKAGSYYYEEEDSRQAGVYTLSVKNIQLPGPIINGGVLPLDGTVFNGLFEGQERTYTLQLDQPRLVTIDMRSEMFDSLLVLKGKNIERENDDGGEGLNSRLNVVLEAGSYEIIAQSARPGTGLFELSATAREVPPAKKLTLGQRVEGQIQAGTPFARYTFTVDNPGNYSISMTSEDIDSYLRLYRGAEEIAHDDDSGSTGLDARIERVALSRGTYIIEASSYSHEETGAYHIEVKRN